MLNALALLCSAYILTTYAVATKRDDPWPLHVANAITGPVLVGVSLRYGAWGPATLSFGFWLIGLLGVYRGVGE